MTGRLRTNPDTVVTSDRKHQGHADSLAAAGGGITVTVDEEQPLRVAVLGPVRAWRGDTELELGAPQRRAVLGLLAVRANQEVARDQLIDGI